MRWDFAIILLILGVPIPLLGLRRIRQLMRRPQTSRSERLALYASTIVFQCAIAALIVWRIVGRGIRLPSLAVAMPRPLLIWEITLGLCVLFVGNQLFALKRLEQNSAKQPGAMVHLATKVFPQSPSERLAFFVLVLTVATCEEFIYRGFVQFVFQRWTSSIFFGILFSSLFFSWAHFYQGRRGVVSTFIVGVIFASVRSWTGSLVPAVVTHFAVDLTAGILAPIRLRRAPSTVSPEASG